VRVAGVYSFNGGKEVIEARFAAELCDVEQIITAVDSEKLKTKTSREKTMPGRRTIFHKLDVIDVGIEVVPVKEFADEMSTGVSYFEQFVWDLEQRGVSDIDIPVLIFGITHK
jgi:hypothetical protein